MNLARLIWPSIAIVAVALLVSDKLHQQQSASASTPGRAENEFYAWEKTPLGTYKQVKKNYTMDERACNNVIAVLNEMSTSQPQSNWILSHTTASTFECIPAKVKPRTASEEPSSQSDDPAVHLAGAGPQSQSKSAKQRLAEGATLATLDQQSMCADQAKKAYADLRYPKDAMAGYESHFNARLNKCFIAVTNTDTRVDPGKIWTYRFVFDAFEGKQYGTYSWHTEKDKKYWEVPPFDCEVTLPSGEKQFCHSDDEFTRLIRIYMEDVD